MSPPSMSRWIIVLVAGLICCPAVLAQPRQPFPGQPNQPGQPFPGQPKQPFPGQPNQPGQPFPGQPNQPGQPFPGQPNQPGMIPGQPNQPGQPFPGQPNPPAFPNQTDPFKPDPNVERAAGRACGGIAAGAFLIIGFAVVVSIVWIFVCVWIAKDAQARGMDNGVMWAVLAFFIGFPGLIIYLVIRTSGGKKAAPMRICRECGKKYSRASKRCPKCDAVYSPKVTR